MNKGKAVKIKRNGDIGICLDEYNSEEKGKMYIVGGLSPNALFFKEDEIEFVEIEAPERTTMLLCDISFTMKSILENIEDALYPRCPECGETMEQCDEEYEDDDGEEEESWNADTNKKKFELN